MGERHTYLSSDPVHPHPGALRPCLPAHNISLDHLGTSQQARPSRSPFSSAMSASPLLVGAAKWLVT